MMSFSVWLCCHVLSSTPDKSGPVWDHRRCHDDCSGQVDDLRSVREADEQYADQQQAQLPPREDLRSEHPDRLDDDGKPEGWRFGTLNDLALLNPESWTVRNAPAQVAYVDLANTKWGSIDKVEYYAWQDAPSRARRILRAGDTIVGTVRPGNGSYSYVGEDGLTGSTGFAVLRPRSARDRAFVWRAATSAENIDRLAHLADGGAYPAVRPDAVAATEIVIPSAPVLDAFRDAVSASIDLIDANKAESRTLAQTRDLLLPRLMSGELRVADAERFAANTV